MIFRIRALSFLHGLLLIALVSGCDDGPGGELSPQPESGGSGTPPEVQEGAQGTEPDYAALRQRMIEELAATIKDARLLEVMRRVPRHEFVPEEHRRQSYQNRALPIAENQTIQQPYLVALMTELLALQGAEKVLEIGTGSGYQAAILGELVPGGEVYTVEIRPKLLEEAREKLEDLKRREILHHGKLETIAGDGSQGYPPAAPYDAILVTAAPRKFPVQLLNQLKPGGRMVTPVGDYYQELQLIRKKEDGSYTEETVAIVRFVPMLDE